MDDENYSCSVGTGYVGIANAVLSAQHNEVTSLDIDSGRVELLNVRKIPIQNLEMEEFSE